MLQQRSDTVLCSVTGDDRGLSGHCAASDGRTLDDVHVFAVKNDCDAGFIVCGWIYHFFVGGWCREYQVLPDRTHPTMMMDSSNRDLE